MSDLEASSSTPPLHAEVRAATLDAVTRVIGELGGRRNHTTEDASES